MNIIITRRESLNVPDGINTYIFTLAHYFDLIGHKVIIVTTFKVDKKLIRHKYNISANLILLSLTNKEYGSKLRKFVLWIMKSKKLINGYSPDLVIVNGAIPVRYQGNNIFVSHDLEKNGRFHFNWMRILYKFISYRFADKIIATTTEIKEGLSKEIFIPNTKISVIPTCYMLSKYKNKKYSERKNAILHFGTIFYKNPLTSLKAFIRMKVPAVLYLTGKITEEIELFLNSLDSTIKEYIVILGYVDEEELLDLLGTVKVMSVPSIYDFPVASPSVIEALASGTPVITTKSISKDVITNGYNGYIIDPKNIDQVSEMFSELVNDEQSWAKLNNGAIESSKQFSVQSIAAKLLNFN